jgi:alpha-amylase/alpha-mannosidase (GH57 family)
MIDFETARDAQPHAELPSAVRYPGGAARVAAHADRAFVEHEARFGAPPVGTWPAEGALSGAVATVIAARGSRWAASGEAVLMNSLRASGAVSGDRAQLLYQPYLLKEAPGMRLFFRDDRLSDLIGFDYSRRHSGEAAAQFVSELESIAANWEGDVPPVVSVMLDGENAWEHFPYNGYYFLDELYRRLAAHPVIRPTTFADLIARDVPTAPLARIAAGSWVYGDLATWIGSPAKNRAWDLLVAAKTAFDRVIDSLAPEAREEACRRLGICEGSDWFWWFGDYNPQQTIASFDSLFRLHLTRLYEQIGVPVPAELAERIHGAHAGGDAEGGGSMRRSFPVPG